MSAHSFETGRRDLCSETSLGGLEPKLNPSRLLCFITTKSRQHATMSHAHLHLYTGLTGRRVEEPIHRPVGRLPKMPPIQTHTYMRAHTCTNPWLSLGPVLDYRIRTLFHYLPTLYRTHTHTQWHTVLARDDRLKTDAKVNQNRRHLHEREYSSTWKKKNIRTILLLRSLK